jgi:site-specific DNA-methyltransferase (adenine-specific)
MNTQKKTDVEILYDVLNSSTLLLSESLQIDYIDALILSGENLFQEMVLQDLDDILAQKLKNLYNTIQLQEMDQDQIRKAVQLAVLKGMKEATQPNHEMTADAVCLFMAYLVERLMKKKSSFTMLDLAIGTGNLTTAILNHSSKQVHATGVEVDDTLLNVAYINANMQRHSVELFKQDSLQPLLVNPADLVVCDLPIGYYPNDDVAKGYELRADSGHSFAHFLFIEKCITQASVGGFIVLLVPNSLFQGEESASLHSYIKKNVVIHGLLQLPLSMFKKEKHAKSIFILQKKGENVRPPSQALLVELPSFSKKEAMQGILPKISKWIDTEIHKG